ncbi:MAG: hypothetical protein PHP64_04605 [Actinomycetota bacterium]|nr:hypothetical protein [Actinomycetota bacterium]
MSFRAAAARLATEGVCGCTSREHFEAGVDAGVLERQGIHGTVC